MLVETGKESLSLPADKRFEGQVSSQKPFGLRTFFRGSETRKSQDDVVVLQSGGRAWTSRGEINVNVGLIDKWKVFTSKSSSEHAGQADKNGMRRVLSLSGVLPPGSVVTETYVLLGAYDDEETARNCMSYVLTKFFRFLVATRSSAQDLSRSAYSLVPMQDFSESWSDEKLYRKYGLTQEQIGFIEASIRPMEIDSNA
jgi:site-specific DNA-methyltransferase (adenine-specific)